MNIINCQTDDLNLICNSLLGVANKISFVVPDLTNASAEVFNLLEDLNIYLIQKTNTSSWPGTQLTGKDDYVTVFNYHFNSEVALVLTSFSDCIYDWVKPYLPEDISFYKDDELIFFSTTHEKESFFTTTEKSIIANLKKYGVI